MPQLTEKAQRIVDTFKQQIDLLPESERSDAIKEMTEYLSSLSEEVRGVIRLIHQPSENTGDSNVMDNIKDFI